MLQLLLWLEDIVSPLQLAREYHNKARLCSAHMLTHVPPLPPSLPLSQESAIAQLPHDNVKLVLVACSSIEAAPTDALVCGQHCTLVVLQPSPCTSATHQASQSAYTATEARYKLFADIQVTRKTTPHLPCIRHSHKRRAMPLHSDSPQADMFQKLRRHFAADRPGALVRVEPPPPHRRPESSP